MCQRAYVEILSTREVLSARKKANHIILDDVFMFFFLVIVDMIYDFFDQLRDVTVLV